MPVREFGIADLGASGEVNKGLPNGKLKRGACNNNSNNRREVNTSNNLECVGRGASQNKELTVRGTKGKKRVTPITTRRG